MYELKTEKFSGPIEKLLELIEEKKLDIAEVSLAEVTADFLKYLKTIKEAQPRMLADFVVVASRLLLIKSKALMPGLRLSEEEEKDIKDLEARLRLYQQLKPLMGLIKERWEKGQASIARQLFFGRPIVFAPAKNVKLQALRDSLTRIVDELSAFTVQTESVKMSLVSLEDKIKEILDRMTKLPARDAGRVGFRELSQEKPRQEIIALFLAILHLLRDQLIRVEQGEGFGEIVIQKQ